MISFEKMNDIGTFTKLPRNVGDLGKLVVALKSRQSAKNRQLWSHCSPLAQKGFIK